MPNSSTNSTNPEIFLLKLLKTVFFLVLKEKTHCLYQRCRRQLPANYPNRQYNYSERLNKDRWLSVLIFHKLGLGPYDYELLEIWFPKPVRVKLPTHNRSEYGLSHRFWCVLCQRRPQRQICFASFNQAQQLLSFDENQISVK